MILDLNNFKQINDSFGNLSGDYILHTVGEELKSFCKPEIYVGRYNGDEFLLLVPNITDYDDTHKLLERLYEEKRL